MGGGDLGESDAVISDPQELLTAMGFTTRTELDQDYGEDYLMVEIPVEKIRSKAFTASPVTFKVWR
jgi:hypothetical protein